MTETNEPADEPTGELVTLELPAEQLQTLSLKDRKLGVRIVPYDVVADHPMYGPIMFKAGAFGEVDPRSVRLRMDHQDPPTGLGTRFWEEPDGAYMEFQLSKTSRADDQLTLAVDGVSRGASVGFFFVPSRTKRQKVDGRSVTVYGPDSARLAELSTTWKPTFSEAGVMYALSAQKGTGPDMTEAQEAPVAGAGFDYEKFAEAQAAAMQKVLDAQRDAGAEAKIETLLSKFDEMVELQRSNIQVPAAVPAKPKAKLHHWVEMTLRQRAGDPMRDVEIRELALDDVITTEQPGLVPTRFTADYDDLISQARPFLSSTRQIAPPATGTSMVLPIITTRAVAGTQAGGQKTELTTTATKVGTGSFAYQAVFGGADIAMQMILRAERSFFDLLTGDMGEAYALDCEVKAINALLTGYTDSASGSHVVVDGGVLDPESPAFGVAWETSILASKRAPTHIWMSAAAVSAFIDAKAPLTNAPLYSNLAASFTAGNGPGGSLSGLTPVYVPALDSEDVDVIVGPSRGFVWAEDPARRLEADVPQLAGRDIALVGGIFPAPRFADAFTTYTIAS